MAGKHRMRLTDASIARLHPREREYAVWDTRVAGLGVRVRPSGGRSYVMLQEAGGRSKRVSLGSVSTKSIAEVRRECLARQAGSGPGNAPEPARAVPLFREFVAGAWKEAHFERYKPSTQKGVRSVLGSQLLPAFGSKPLDRISRARIEHWFDAFSRTAPGNANRALDLLRQIMNFAIACGHIDTNPAQGMKSNRRPPLTRFLSLEEIGRLHRVLNRQTRRKQPAAGRHHPPSVADRMPQDRDRPPALVRGPGRHDRARGQQDGTEKGSSQHAGQTCSRTTAAKRECLRVSFPARPGPTARPQSGALVSGPS